MTLRFSDEGQVVMDLNNPYAAPAAELSSPSVAALAPTGDLATVVQGFRDTRPWLRLLSIAGFLGLGLATLGLLAAAAFEEGAYAPAAVMMSVLVVYAIPLVQLHLFANAIDRLVRSPDVASLEDTVSRQRSFWRTIGVLFLLGVLLSVVTSLAMPFL